MTQSYFISGAEPGVDLKSTLWHVCDDLRLLARCGTAVGVTARVPLIDLAAFSSRYRVCFTCAPGADVPAFIGDGLMAQAELALEVEADY